MNLKFYTVVLLILTIISCNKKETEINDEINTNIDWLIGSWTRSNDKPNRQTFEQWQKHSDNEYIGIGVTLVNSDTVFKENLRLVNSGNNWTLEVRGVNDNMTPFDFINLTDSSFTCVNENNEFPKKINYKITNSGLVAIISDDSREIKFSFRKK